MKKRYFKILIFVSALVFLVGARSVLAKTVTLEVPDLSLTATSTKKLPEVVVNSVVDFYVPVDLLERNIMLYFMLPISVFSLFSFLYFFFCIMFDLGKESYYETKNMLVSGLSGSASVVAMYYNFNYFPEHKEYSNFWTDFLFGDLRILGLSALFVLFFIVFLYYFARIIEVILMKRTSYKHVQ